MIYYRYYEARPDQVEELASSQRMGRLVSVDEAGGPRLGLYPFLRTTEGVEVHLVRRDEQAEDLRQRPRCLFEVDEVLSYIPSYWEDPRSAQNADSFYRLTSFEGTALVIDDAEQIADHLRRLLNRYQPEGRYEPVTTADPGYAAAIRGLSLIRIQVNRIRTKFKLGQKYPADTRQRILDGLAARGEAMDKRTAELLRETLES